MITQVHARRTTLGWRLYAGFGCALLLMAPGVATAAPPLVLAPTSVPMTGRSGEMISYRQEKHSWVTPDGALHLMVNVGNRRDGAALRLYTTPDGGATWAAGPMLAATDSFSTGDGLQDGDALDLAYATHARDILYQSLRWDPATGTWTSSGVETAFASDAISAINPSIAEDAQGRLWVAFTARTANGQNDIHAVVRDPDSQAWIDPGLNFGPVNKTLPLRRSARLVPIPGGMGLIYTVHRSMYWATRADSDPIDAPWSAELLYTYTGTSKDPYRSHFSIARDANGNIHMALTDGGRVLYLRYLEAAATWQSRWLTGNVGANYPQVATGDGAVWVAANVRTNVGVYVSRDGGRSFTLDAMLVHGSAGPSASFTDARIETPEQATSPMRLFQQYSDDGIQHLLEYAIPPAEGSTASPR